MRAIKIGDVDALQRVVAVHAIRDLVVTYAMAFDDHDWARLGSLWTDDAAFVVGDQAFEGREAVMAFLSTCLGAGSEQERQEEFVAGRVAAGEQIDGLYPLGERWRPAYEAWLAERKP